MNAMILVFIVLRISKAKAGSANLVYVATASRLIRSKRISGLFMGSTFKDLKINPEIL